MASCRRSCSAPKPEIAAEAIPVLQGKWKLCSVEEMQIGGAVPKNYLVFGNPEDSRSLAFIAKLPRVYGDRECVTEHMIASVGKLLPLKVAKSRLVRLPLPGRNKYEIRFLSRNFLIPGKTALKHGVELVADYVGGSRGEVHEVFNLGDPIAEQRFYTLEMILDVLKWYDQSSSPSLEHAFGRMLAFDALVGAQDRHAENWGVIEYPGDPDAPRTFAPIYDTARGMFADHADKKFEEIESQNRREQHLSCYAKRSRPVFGCADIPDRVNHFTLVQYALTKFRRQLGEPISQIVTAFDFDATKRLLIHEVGRVISPLRMRYVLDLLRLRYRLLRELVADYYWSHRRTSL